jgi:hypothetical protein
MLMRRRLTTEANMKHATLFVALMLCGAAAGVCVVSAGSAAAQQHTAVAQCCIL